ncbi:MAG: hypothetical protein M1820_008253 [Bogoriella megaspora]|nr:MAG: hypothetical protein M1820_008253 [Bogoriella megaspora]
MPPRITVPKSSPRSSLRNSSLDLVFCRSCSLWRLPHPRSLRKHYLNPPPRRLQHTAPTSSPPYLSSRTAINAPVSVPEAHIPLYNALAELQSNPDVNTYVNLSRVQLALRGLERGNTVVRIAVLGIHGETGIEKARKLVRLLLADPLAGKGEWEGRIEGQGVGEVGGDGRGLLIRYGDENETLPHNPLVETILAPSRILERHNIEILLSGLNIDANGPGAFADAQEAKEAILVPSLQTPISSTGRAGFVTYPVHSALLVGEGVEDAVAWGKYTGRFENSTGDGHINAGLVKVALDIPGGTTAVEGRQEESELAIINIKEGSRALDKFRESTANAVAYEHGWLESNIQALQDWIEQIAPTRNGLSTSGDDKLHPALRTLLDSLLTDTSTKLNLAEAENLKVLASSSLSEDRRRYFRDILAGWSEHAHRELQDSLEEAFASKTWRRLRWWKLFWRVDDVGMMTDQLLHRQWLRKSQEELLLLLGRLSESGILQGGKDLLVGKEKGSEDSVSGLAPHLQNIATTRARLLQELNPELQAKAQAYVLNSLGTFSLTAAFSALTYVWSLGPTLEAAAPGFFSGTWAGAIFSGGLVYALARLQSRWEKALMQWESTVREEGRLAIKDTEDILTRKIRQDGKESGGTEEANGRRRARWVVERCRMEMEKLGK